MDETFTWKRINSLIDEMFTHNYENGTLNRRKIHFYGNDGVCLFKYFVNESDPQKGFVWTCLGINLLCFFIVCICYSIINLKSKSSTQNVGNVNQGNERIVQERRQTQKNIAIIILTDFVCWVPFIFVCGLHSLDIIDATSTYPIFSLVVLPINSVINPLLYGDFFGDHIKKLKTRTRNLLEQLVRRIQGPAPTTAEEIELVVIPNRAPQQSAPLHNVIPRIIITNADTAEEIINGNLIGYRDHVRNS